MFGDVTTSVFVDAAPSEVFEFFTRADLLVEWMGEAAVLDPTPGGRLAIEINGTSVRGRYLVVEPPDRLVFSWGFAGSDDLPPEASTVEVNLVAEPDGTRVTLVHRLLPPARQRGHEVGWCRYLGHLGRVAPPKGNSETMRPRGDASTRPGALPKHPCARSSTNSNPGRRREK